MAEVQAETRSDAPSCPPDRVRNLAYPLLPSLCQPPTLPHPQGLLCQLSCVGSVTQCWSDDPLRHFCKTNRPAQGTCTSLKSLGIVSLGQKKTPFIGGNKRQNGGDAACVSCGIAFFPRLTMSKSLALTCSHSAISQLPMHRTCAKWSDSIETCFLCLYVPVCDLPLVQCLLYSILFVLSTHIIQFPGGVATFCLVSPLKTASPLNSELA